jgi:hypothetical protein
MNCFLATIKGCNNQNYTVDPLSFIYGLIIPAGKVNGVIVFLDGGDGTSAASEPDEQDILAYYVTQNYAVVQIQWATAWEQNTVASVQNAACRPATFLNYIYNTVYTTITTGQNANPNAGMCAQGFSAGSAAVAYSLAYYGAGSYLDNVELISGPVLSDIKQGCIVPAAASVTVCPPQQNGQPQYGCRLGSDVPWMLPPIYAPNDTTYVRAVDKRHYLQYWKRNDLVGIERRVAEAKHCGPEHWSHAYIQLSKHRDGRMALHPATAKPRTELHHRNTCRWPLPEQFQPPGAALLCQHHRYKLAARV